MKYTGLFYKIKLKWWNIQSALLHINSLLKIYYVVAFNKQWKIQRWEMPSIQEQHQQQKLQNISYLQRNPTECYSIHKTNILNCGRQERVPNQRQGNLLYNIIHIYSKIITNIFETTLVQVLNLVGRKS